jgi:hypothetical protein
MLANQIADSPDGENVLVQFNRLIEELLAGKMQRCKFQTWEIDILLDIMSCDLGQFADADGVLRQYREAAQQQLENGAPLPMRFSNFLASRPESAVAGRHRRRAISVIPKSAQA